MTNPTQDQSPSDRWSVDVQVQAETTPEATANVSVEEGSVKLTLEATNGTTVVRRVESCGAGTN